MPKKIVKRGSLFAFIALFLLWYQRLEEIVVDIAERWMRFFQEYPWWEGFLVGVLAGVLGLIFLLIILWLIRSRGDPFRTWILTFFRRVVPRLLGKAVVEVCVVTPGSKLRERWATVSIWNKSSAYIRVPLLLGGDSETFLEFKCSEKWSLDIKPKGSSKDIKIEEKVSSSESTYRIKIKHLEVMGHLEVQAFRSKGGRFILVVAE